MALAKDVALDLLTKLEADLQAHKTGGAASIYEFAGTKNGERIGMSRTVNRTLNRAGQVLQYLAGYFTSTTDSALKARIAKATAEVYNIYASQPIITVYAEPDYTKDTDIETNGHFPADPSGGFFFLGMMMIDKQGVIDHPSFAQYSAGSASYVRGTVIPRLALKANRCVYLFDNEKKITPSLKNDAGYTWYTQKIAPQGLNGTCLMLSLLSLYSKLYNVPAYNQAYLDAFGIMRRVTTDFSTTYDAAGNPLTTTQAGQHPGTNMCVPIGAPLQSRGAFPSIGYTSIVGLAYVLQAFAERANTSHKFSDMRNVIDGHPLYIDALKIVNYYRDRVKADGELFQIGAHRNYGGDATRFKDDWRNDIYRRINMYVQFNGSGQFDKLADINEYPGRGGYSYTMAWINPTHSFFSELEKAYAPSKGGRAPYIDHARAGSGKTVAQGFAATHEAASARVAVGIGVGMMFGLTTVN